MKSEVLSVKEKIGYGMGDAASHIIFDNVMLYMMFFYTDIFGIPAGFVGTMFLVARALDAIIPIFLAFLPVLSEPCFWSLVHWMRFPILAWGCWPIERALAGVNFVRGYCLAHCHSGSSVYWPIARQISV